MVSGDRSFVTPADAEALRLSGLAHLLSISGVHMVLVGGVNEEVGAVQRVSRGVVILEGPSRGQRVPWVVDVEVDHREDEREVRSRDLS